MKIAVLAWGSLVWNRRDLAISASFEPTGPHLPLEFCRVSGDGRLTLVIDERFGSPCATYWAPGSRIDLDASIENLRSREGMPNTKGVGFIDRVTGRQSVSALERHPRAVESIDSWADANRYDAAIWTALGSNFHEADKAGEPFSVEAAIRYLEARDVPTLDRALAYIRQAPVKVQTPLRAAVTARWPEG